MADYGLQAAVKKTILYALQGAYESRCYRIYGIDLEIFEPRPPRKSEFVFKEVNPSQFGMIRQIEDMEEWLSGQVALQLEKGAYCLAAFKGEEVVSFNLVQFRQIFIPLIKMKRVFKPDEAWSEQITVHKKFRKMGLAQRHALSGFCFAQGSRHQRVLWRHPDQQRGEPPVDAEGGFQRAVRYSILETRAYPKMSTSGNQSRWASRICRHSSVGRLLLCSVTA